MQLRLVASVQASHTDSPPETDYKPERVSARLGFAQRPNHDGTFDSICRACYITVATSFWEAELEKSEREHVCDKKTLERFYSTKS